MSETLCLFDRWTEENNIIIRKWKEYEKHRQSLQDIQKQCYAECLKLQQKIQGLPASTEQLKLDLGVAYNTVIFSLSNSKANEAKHHLNTSLERALEAVGAQVPGTDLVTLWQVVLKTFGGSVHQPWIHKLVLVQWAIWLSECHFEGILHLLQQVNPNEQITPSEDLLSEIRNLTFSIPEDASLLVAMAARDLKDLLHICTFISKGAEQMKKENYTEALLAFQEASTLSSPRILLAHIHTLTGLNFSKLGRPQSALQCYRKALEVDFTSQRALYESSLVYQQLGNSHAEIEALHLLHSAALSHTERNASPPHTLISPQILLGNEQMAFISQMPSPVLILHTLAHRCVLSDRNSEGAEFYLDLLASLQSDSRPQVLMNNGLALPRIPVIYLEAAFSMLKAKRSWDALAICEEVIVKTVDLVPERLLIETPAEDHKSASSTKLSIMSLQSDAVEEKLDCVLWSGAAYFLQGHAHLQLKDTKEALTNFTRAINQLVKVCIKPKLENLGETEYFDTKVVVLNALKGQTFAGRGVCFAERSQLKEALRDFQLSLQAYPGCRNTEMWLVEILWRLNRKEEAAALWKQTHNSTDSPAPVNLPLYLQECQEDATHLDHSSLNKKMEEFISSCSLKVQT